MQRHKNKTFATFLAFAFGSIGLHCFYLQGWRNRWGWVHLLSLPLALLLLGFGEGMARLLSLAPLIFSALAGFLGAFFIGLCTDEKWDARHNAGSGRRSDSGWLLALLLVLTVAVGATTLIASIARSVDLYLTGGAYG